MIMKRFNRFVCAALAVAAVAACDNEPEVVDFPIVGDFTITAAYPGEGLTYAHGGQGWTASDKLGVFVTSDGVAQANLPYVPSEVCPLVDNEYVPGMKSYDDDNVVVDAVALKAEGTKAGFKQGEHTIYAYTPYAADATDYTAVPMPDLTVQNPSNPINGLFSPNPAYLFAYAKAEAGSELSATPVALGNMKPVYTQMTLMSPTFAEDAVGKKVTAITVSADVDIVAKNATFNLATEKIEGEMSKTVSLTLPAEGLEIMGGYFGASYEGTSYVVLNIDGNVGLNTEFTFEFVLDDGTKLTAKSAPASAPMSNAGNLNMYGCIDFSAAN